MSLHRFQRCLSALLGLGICSAAFMSSPWLAARPRLRSVPAIVELREADVIFQRGSGILSRAVLNADTASPFSHVGLIVLQDGEPMVIHAAPGPRFDGDAKIMLEKLVTFLASGREAAVYRVFPEMPGLSDRVATASRRFVAEGRRFDSAFDLDTEERLYCTELVWKAYAEAGLDLAGDRFSELGIPLFDKPCLLPSGLLANPRLQLVHVFDVGGL